MWERSGNAESDDLSSQLTDWQRRNVEEEEERVLGTTERFKK